jgi:hypothetical protein
VNGAVGVAALVGKALVMANMPPTAKAQLPRIATAFFMEPSVPAAVFDPYCAV